MSTDVSSGLSRADLAIDHELADVGSSFRFLLDLTPVDVDAARREFLAGATETPRFSYRPFEDDPEVIKTRLAAIHPEAVADPTVAHLLHAKHRELSLQLEMLCARGSDAFRALSVELYGAVTPSLLEQAEHILRITPPGGRPDGPPLDATAFARRADAELERYRAAHPDLSAHVEIRSDVSSIMVSEGHLLVPDSARVPAGRVEALLHHEIGTHVVTFVNGAHQPLRLLAGLAGYDETQEGLALLAEQLVGGLTPNRLRHVAARVVAVDRMLKGERFRSVHETVTGAGFSPAAAFTTTMRVFRSGGLTKDAVYLRGLADLLAHVGAGRGIDALLLGKMPLDAVPLIEELATRGALVEPLLVPRFLALPGSRERLAAIGPETGVSDLLAGAR
jgi:uncharacterized protein (TIGR02421 family)